MDTENAAIVNAALDALLAVIDRSTADLKKFHEVLAHARLSGPPPFPRVAVASIESIVDQLKGVEERLQELMVALGLSGPSRS
jgi:hypothetical protein